MTGISSRRDKSLMPSDTSTSLPKKHDQVILTLRKSLETFLAVLPNVDTFEVSQRKTVLSSHNDILNDSATLTNSSNQERVNLTTKAIELDESILALLTYTGSEFSLWIFDNFIDSISLQNTLWTSFYYLAIKCYRQHVVGKYNDEEMSKLPAKARTLIYDRFINLCKHITYYYKQFITRMIEKFGYTPQIHYVISVLRLVPENLNHPFASNQKTFPSLHSSIHDSLCHMGDLSRYRSLLRYHPQEANSSYSHALIYYTTASKIRPSSGVPLNQLGNINYSRGDVFTATYYFLRSMAVDEPFQDGAVNLRIILRKLTKLKDSTLSEKPIFGLRDEMSDDLAESPESAGTGSNEATASQKEAKETLLQIMQLFSSYFLAQLPGKGSSEGSKGSSAVFDPFLSQNLQRELTDKLYDLCKNKAIPSRIISKLVIVSITFVWLLQQASELSKSKSQKPQKAVGASLSSRDAYKSAMSFTLRIFDKLLSVALRHLVNFSGNGKRLPSEVASLLPSFRILFDWTRKQLAERAIMEWGQDMAQCNAIFLKCWQLLEHMRKFTGFSFDVITAVARSNWDRFDEILKSEGEYYNPELALEDEQHNSKRSIHENYEETHSIGLLALDGGLSDTPTGLDPAESTSQRHELDMYRIQCLLFSGVEISRLDLSFLILDEFQGNKAMFGFETIEIEEFSDEEPAQAPPPPLQMRQNSRSPVQNAQLEFQYSQGLSLNHSNTNGGYPVGYQSNMNMHMGEEEEERVVDESEYYNIGRNDAGIMNGTLNNITASGAGISGSHFGRSGNMSMTNGNELFPRVHNMNSASPAFLSKLYDLEQAQFKQKFKNRSPMSRRGGGPGNLNGQKNGPINPGITNNDPDLAALGTPTKPKGSKKRRNRRRRNNPETNSVGPFGASNISGSNDAMFVKDDESDEGEEEEEEDKGSDDDEEIVFAGRGRGRG